MQNVFHEKQGSVKLAAWNSWRSVPLPPPPPPTASFPLFLCFLRYAAARLQAGTVSLPMCSRTRASHSAKTSFVSQTFVLFDILKSTQCKQSFLRCPCIFREVRFWFLCRTIGNIASKYIQFIIFTCCNNTIDHRVVNHTLFCLLETLFHKVQSHSGSSSSVKWIVKKRIY